MDHSIYYHKFNSEEIDSIRNDMLEWYDTVQRVLPWRKPSVKYMNICSDDEVDQYSEKLSNLDVHAYSVLVSEIMLQQTRVDTVIDYFQRWMEIFPTIEDLAEADIEDVRAAWAGLGYYRRATYLHECAKQLVEGYNSKLPQTAKELLKLRGVGRYTSGAIASIAFGEKSAAVDGNVIRVLSRVRAISAEAKKSNIVDFYWKLASDLVPPDRPGDFNQSLMELGATVCSVRNPSCTNCPISDYCNAYKEVSLISDRQLEKGVKPCTLCTESRGPAEQVVMYPLKIKKKQKKIMNTIVTIIENYSSETQESKFVVVKRPEGGLLGSFWEFPSIDITKAFDKYRQHKNKMDGFLPSLFDLNPFDHWLISDRFKVGTLEHLFTHIKQILSIEYITVEGDLLSGSRVQWISTIEDLPISTGMKKCLALALKKRNSRRREK
eukprot:TRINITY_DN7091_c0_g1_i1.p1 TRINITY_DN7091_c0_g1~~TRINITY_DN7091_c0_g1_i1.p1  ORF type:complete len:499 (-),score=96.96 TRINITY_DN7091_c0_g1_i1:36-1343(-)